MTPRLASSLQHPVPLGRRLGQADHRARQHDRALDDGRIGARPSGGRSEPRLVHRRALGVDADDRMDTRHHLRDIAHVGASERQRRLDLLADRVPAQAHHLGTEGIGQPLVGVELVVGWLALFDLVVATRRHRPGEEAVGDPVLELAQRRGVVGAHCVMHLRASRDDVGGLPAVGDDAVHHLSRRQLLAEQSDGDLSDRDRVGGVEAQVRRHRSVRLPPDIANHDLGQRQRARAGDVQRPGVQHHRGSDVVKGSGLEQQHCSTARLLRGRAEQHHRQSQLVGHLRQRQRGADRGSGDDVVPAGMSDTG